MARGQHRRGGTLNRARHDYSTTSGRTGRFPHMALSFSWQEQGQDPTPGEGRLCSGQGLLRAQLSTGEGFCSSLVSIQASAPPFPQGSDGRSFPAGSSRGALKGTGLLFLAGMGGCFSGDGDGDAARGVLHSLPRPCEANPSLPLAPGRLSGGRAAAQWGHTGKVSHTPRSVTPRGLSHPKVCHTLRSVTLQGQSHPKVCHTERSIPLQGQSHPEVCHTLRSITLQGQSHSEVNHTPRSVTLKGQSHCKVNHAPRSVTLQGQSHSEVSDTPRFVTLKGQSHPKVCHTERSITLQGQSCPKVCHTERSVTPQGLSHCKVSHTPRSVTLKGQSHPEVNRAPRSVTLQGQSHPEVCHTERSVWARVSLG
ncbi:uncharacterized protein LOC131088906 isoform X8 [Melospiza georgiana]|uniref:uncharacterized protein LOC131088906 isoform X8 n=1 Tax=Melospiza georgiana TaxID=44398 RepID=UPI0025ACC3A0|nr:uncharacterized protein LOC131088906 isoform X8 [Melospiza georgiana]